MIVDDFSRVTWVLFLTYKDDVLEVFTTFCKKVQNEKGYTITSIRSDHDQRYAQIPREPPENLTPIPSPWPFIKWGMDIVGKLPAAQG